MSAEIVHRLDAEIMTIQASIAKGRPVNNFMYPQYLLERLRDKVALVTLIRAMSKLADQLGVVYEAPPHAPDEAPPLSECKEIYLGESIHQALSLIAADHDESRTSVMWSVSYLNHSSVCQMMQSTIPNKDVVQVRAQMKNYIENGYPYVTLWQHVDEEIRQVEYHPNV